MEQPQVAIFLLVAALVILLVVAGTIIFILRRIQGSPKQAGQTTQAADEAAQLREAYQRAGLRIKSTGFLGRVTVEGTHSGTPFTQLLVPGTKDTPPRAILRAPSTLRGEFGARREGVSDSLFKSIGIAQEAQTGDAAFDGAVYLLGRSRAYVEALFSEARNREALRALFALGFDRVELRDGRLEATRDRQASLLELKSLHAALDLFAELRPTATSLHIALQGIGGVSTRQINTVCAALAIVAVSAVAAGLFLLEPALDGPFALFADNWPGLLGLYAALAVLALIALRGRPGAAAEIGIAAFVGIPGLVAGAVGGATLANQWLDRSPAEAIDAPLVRHYVRSGKNRYYHLVFADWRAQRGTIDLQVSSGVYDRAADGQVWTIRTRAGRLGYPWVESMAPRAAR